MYNRANGCRIMDLSSTGKTVYHNRQYPIADKSINCSLISRKCELSFAHRTKVVVHSHFAQISQSLVRQPPGFRPELWVVEAYSVCELRLPLKLFLNFSRYITTVLSSKCCKFGRAFMPRPEARANWVQHRMCPLLSI